HTRFSRDWSSDVCSSDLGSLAEAVRYEPEGVYTVTNTYQTTQVLKFDAHLNRMEDSAMRADISLKIDRRELRRALRQMVEEAGRSEERRVGKEWSSARGR